MVALQEDFSSLSSDYENINHQLDTSREQVAMLIEKLNKTQATNRAKIRQYEKDILRICYLYLHELEQSRDAVQETFLKAYIHLDRLQDPSKEKSWLTKIAVNICRDHLRSPWVTHMNRYVQPEDLRIAAEQENVTHTALTAAVMSLPRKYMEAIMLRYIQGCGIQETADILGITPSAVSRRCSRACARLKCELEGSDEING